MLLKLENKELDIVLSKKIDSKHQYKNIKYIKLGMLNEVLVAGYNSKWINKKITIEDIKKADLYMPRKTSETPRNFFELVNCKYEEFSNITHITYKTIVKIIQDNEGIGLLTKEFIKKEIRANSAAELVKSIKCLIITSCIRISNLSLLFNIILC